MRIITIALILQLFILQGFSQVGYTQEGIASVYAEKFEGRTTASGESYSFRKATCAHLTLPFGSIVKVTNLSNNQSVVVRVNDRGPFAPDRIIDLSRSAAEKLGFLITGTAKVKIEVVENPAYSNLNQVSTQNPAPINQTKTQTVEPNIKDNIPQPKVEVELYELKVNQIQPKGFSIQIGSYKEMVNMLRIANDLKSSFKKEIRVQVITLNNEIAYRLFIGGFSTRKDAEGFKEKVAKIYPDCFIVELK
jgi:rare lipoprotein A